MTQPHISVLLNPVIDCFRDLKLSIFVDGTLGAGGHSEAILTHHPEIEQLVGIDQDPQALNLAKSHLEPWKEKLTLVSGNFSELEKHLNQLQIESVDGILLDVGVSSMQLDQAEKGFSFSKEGPLDMRMDPDGETTAADIVNTWSEKDLGKIFREYGEERRWRAAASQIVKARTENRIETTLQLAEILKPVLFWKKKRVNPLTLIFQALRIAVNQELMRIEEVIPQAMRVLRKGGRLAIISFHSLEDRIVKNAFRHLASDKENTSGIGGVFLSKDKEVNLVTRKPLIPTDQEIKENPRCRSAKLRIIEKI